MTLLNTLSTLNFKINSQTNKKINGSNQSQTPNGYEKSVWYIIAIGGPSMKRSDPNITYFGYPPNYRFN
ncbi:hypothetical protein CYY_003717 [Polysphondylium violaceum]|uniref:Uncharacterized protein n=1 Tax=Polysphondylium violaceum TaxID=133409 RepID=A0A8J4PVV4_9MYCE|nr:hypothetical protein CYY_003717 [Polysphondylium violaceum]